MTPHIEVTGNQVSFGNPQTTGRHLLARRKPHRGMNPIACLQFATVRSATSSAVAAPFASTSASHASSCTTT